MKTAVLVAAALALGVGATYTSWPRGVPYVDGGATAVDAYDGAVSVVTTGVVKWRVAGYYEVVYTAWDSSGNEARAVRKVRVTR